MDHFLSNSGGSAIIVYASMVMVLLYFHPDPSPTTYIYDETVALAGVAAGVVIGQSLGPNDVMVAIIEKNRFGKCVLIASSTRGGN